MRGQAPQAPWPGRTPKVHPVQAAGAVEASGQKLPAGHCKHADWPAAGWYVPGEQFFGAAAPARL